MMKIRFGCPFWSQSRWQGRLFVDSNKKQTSLQSYSSLFNSVEGNTSFYQLPNEETVLSWKEQVKEDFSFTFKFPQQISHHGALTDDIDFVDLVLQRFALLEEQLGCVMLQLPSSFGPSRLDELDRFLDHISRDFTYAVEVRHLALFDKSDNEKRLNQILAAHEVNRVIMDTRALFACRTELTPLIKEVQSRKPKVPTNVIATAETPLIRFVGHPILNENIRFFAPWIKKLEQWLGQGLDPFIFFHMHDKYSAPWLAELFFEHWREVSPQLKQPRLNLPPIDGQQMDIFG